MKKKWIPPGEISHAEHLELANEVGLALHLVRKIQSVCEQHYRSPWQSPKVHAEHALTHLRTLQRLLNNAYLEVSDERQQRKHGKDIYYQPRASRARIVFEK